jgi:predicted TIM-barrel fold metal-dependent hydrolase
MKLDVFNHILPKGYFDKLVDIIPDRRMLDRYPHLATLWNLDERLRMMEEYAGTGYCQLLSLANPPLELLAGPDESPALARLANDGMAEVCKAHPDLFPAFTASLPMNNPDAALAEAERAIDELDARGVQVFTNVLGKPLSAPEFAPLFDLLAEKDLPVWVHPVRGPNHPDYATETVSENEIWFTFGWPYETSACMARLIFSGLFDRQPGMKIITHHFGGMIPFFANKIALGFEQIFENDPDRNPVAMRAGLKKAQPLDYFRMLYADTALNGSAPSTACGHAFFTTSHSLFATDAPFDARCGRDFIDGTISAVNALDISETERAEIYAGNAKKLLNL